MASILRQIVAGPRARHPEAGLDLCYVTDFLIATSGPSSTYPKRAYRNPTDQLVNFLDYKHGEEWSIWEFRAEGTGYPDSEVYGRIHHFPWPDHHPPPFALIPNIMASMRKWLKYEDEEEDGKKHRKKRVLVVHCKAGKGRSGTIACSYLISQEGWKAEDALERFTQRRMRVGFGAGVSIPSQLRWVGYVDRWTNELGKKYVERPVEIVEIHVWGLRDGVKVAVEGFVEDGRRIENFHIFTRKEKTIFDDGTSASTISLDQQSAAKENSSETALTSPGIQSPVTSTPSLSAPMHSSTGDSAEASSSSAPPGRQTVLLRPSSPVILPTSDINIDFERRNRAPYTGFTMVTSVAHVWFNAYFEGGSQGYDSGVFEINWEAMDGIKGSARKGTKALDRLKVLWRYAKSPSEPGQEGEDRIGRVITEPGKGEAVPEGKPTDWRGPRTQHEQDTAAPDKGLTSGRHHGGVPITVGTYAEAGAAVLGKQLGLRKDNAESVDISRANSLRSDPTTNNDTDDEHPSYPSAEEDNTNGNDQETSNSERNTGIDSPSPAGFGKTDPKKPQETKTPEILFAEQQAERQKTHGAITPTPTHEALPKNPTSSTSSKPSTHRPPPPLPPREIPGTSTEAGHERGHEPVISHGPEGPEAITYEDDESDEEAVAPSNSPEIQKKISRQMEKEKGKADEKASGGDAEKGQNQKQEREQQQAVEAGVE